MERPDPSVFQSKPPLLLRQDGKYMDTAVVNMRMPTISKRVEPGQSSRVGLDNGVRREVYFFQEQNAKYVEHNLD